MSQSDVIRWLFGINRLPKPMSFLIVALGYVQLHGWLKFFACDIIHFKCHLKILLGFIPFSFSFNSKLWLQALSELHDQIPPFPREAAMQIIEEELDSPVESVFSYISDEPVAAASFGQVGLKLMLNTFSSMIYQFFVLGKLQIYLFCSFFLKFILIRGQFQVYRGKTVDGFNVAVKVQRPNLRHVVVRDIYILRLGVCINSFSICFLRSGFFYLLRCP